MFNLENSFVDRKTGFIRIDEDLIFYPGYSFEEFRMSKHYRGEDGILMISLQDKYWIGTNEFYVSFFFRKNKLYMVSYLIHDKRITMENEIDRKKIHDRILCEMGLEVENEFSWGSIKSNYDPKGNVSSIGIVYY